jgi:predicted ribosome quality control (RQC) complex YloA/Tae2 family protein
VPLDGIVLRSLSAEFTQTLLGARIEKINQPEKEEIILQLHNQGKKYRLLLSANASAPRVHLTDAVKANPTTPPNFCILLRKYVMGGKIIGFVQNGLERILEINIESADLLGDITLKTLVTEIMGKHSNIILLNHNRKTIDSLKHIDFETSRLREVLPGREYVYPETQDKKDILTSSKEEIEQVLSSVESNEVEKKLVNSFAGISPFFARTLTPALLPHQEKGEKQWNLGFIDKIIQHQFDPCLILNTESKVIDFHAFIPQNGLAYQKTESMNKALESFFGNKSTKDKLNQKRADLIKIANHELQKCSKKIGFQEQKLRDVANREALRLYGELVTANLYQIKDGASEVSLINYYTNLEIIIPLDAHKTPAKNAQLFYKKYQKAKDTYDAVNIQLAKLLKEKDYLENVLCQLELSETESDLLEIRQELISQGIIKSHEKNKKINTISEPHRFVSNDGFEILVGKNNVQNDRLTLKQASNTDIWLHTQKIPGSHVIIRTEKKEVPDSTLLEAANYAAYFSKARMSSHVPVDYTFVRNVKKPSGAKPGFVIYEEFKTIYVTPKTL